jgi:hypothetical protein
MASKQWWNTLPTGGGWQCVDLYHLGGHRGPVCYFCRPERTFPILIYANKPFRDVNFFPPLVLFVQYPEIILQI